MNKQQRGFTLIELIIVIVILGILAVTAAPRFIDIQSEARTETLNGVKGALQGSAQLVFAKAAIGGVQKLAAADTGSEVTIAGTAVQTNFGYPDAIAYTAIGTTVSGSTSTPGIGTFVDLDTNQLTLYKASATATEFRITFEGEDASTNNCYVSYTNAPAVGGVPTVATVSTGC
ncbi:prepilin-type N-terminal cleavage/methylation domain-containing protein [Glaciecola sp. SC05]|uniref:prepilin-type N-terminal cleavage/methylation domain-containing protein n=1 Tax=Glaciecola sp. SC05 TaxID=1987355 RepID=UPI0035270A98